MNLLVAGQSSTAKYRFNKFALNSRTRTSYLESLLHMSVGATTTKGINVFEHESCTSA
jgi:hypothetical protein